MCDDNIVKIEMQKKENVSLLKHIFSRFQTSSRNLYILH